VIFGYLKSDARLKRNHLHADDGDHISAILVGCGYWHLSKISFLFVVGWLFSNNFFEKNHHSPNRANGSGALLSVHP